MTSKPLMRRLVVAAAVLLMLAGKPTSSSAQQGPPNTQMCMSNLVSCYYWASAQAGFWYMWAGGIDCELAMISCIRQAVIGR